MPRPIAHYTTVRLEVLTKELQTTLTQWIDVLPALQGLIVEHLDADVSGTSSPRQIDITRRNTDHFIDWDGSQASSDGLEHIARDITDVI